MASRVTIAPPRQRAGVVAGIHKPKAPESNNRRALGDVGNLIIRGIHGKSKQVSRPVTRGFCAQACNIENNNNKKKPVIADGAALVPERKVTNKPPQKEVVVVKLKDNHRNPKPERVVIEISEANKENPGTQESSVKDVQTSTSVVSASSKVPCGLVDKTNKDQTVDIDAGDVDNQLAAVEYNQINEKMRMILVDWLIEVHHIYKLSPETLYLTIQIIDRYLSTHLVQRKELQLLGISSMLLASKYEEIWAPKVDDLVYISERAYSKEHVLGMEKSILDKLDGLQYGMVKFCPSMLAASAVYAARCTLSKTPLWDETLNFHTGFSESQLIDCAKLLVSFHSRSAEHKLNSVYRKYSSSERCSVALLAAAKML
ncbi:hypothetical protein MKX01_020981 [Papaver californicum]|nr:hypothetical protein MKX01_020981 [Papaver californicum]